MLNHLSALQGERISENTVIVNQKGWEGNTSSWVSHSLRWSVSWFNTEVPPALKSPPLSAFIYWRLLKLLSHWIPQSPLTRYIWAVSWSLHCFQWNWANRSNYWVMRQCAFSAHMRPCQAKWRLWGIYGHMYPPDDSIGSSFRTPQC